MANVYVGDSKALVFPVMCDGHLKLEYDDTNTSTSKGNFWNHTDRFSHKMMIFYNEYFQLYLENTTKNNFNQPAEYKIVAKIRDATSELFHEIATETLIKPVNTLYGYYDADGLYVDNSTSLTELQGDTVLTGNLYPNNITFPSGADNVASLAAHPTGGTELFNSNGLSVGRVTAKPFNNVVTVTNIANHTSALYVSQPKEALYVESIYKISCVYYSGGQLDIYLNNSLKESYTFSSTPTFEFKADDTFIGNNGYTTPSITSQFMGELYEISLSKGKDPGVTDTTLTPSYSNILFYYTFGE